MLASEDQVREFAAYIATRTGAIAAGTVPAADLHALAETLHEDMQLLRTITDPCSEPHPDHVAKQIARRMPA